MPDGIPTAQGASAGATASSSAMPSAQPPPRTGSFGSKGPKKSRKRSISTEAVVLTPHLDEVTSVDGGDDEDAGCIGLPPLSAEEEGPSRTSRAAALLSLTPNESLSGDALGLTELLPASGSPSRLDRLSESTPLRRVVVESDEVDDDSGEYSRSMSRAGDGAASSMFGFSVDAGVGSVTSDGDGDWAGTSVAATSISAIVYSPARHAVVVVDKNNLSNEQLSGRDSTARARKKKKKKKGKHAAVALPVDHDEKTTGGVGNDNEEGAELDDEEEADSVMVGDRQSDFPDNDSDDPDHLVATLGADIPIVTTLAPTQRPVSTSSILDDMLHTPATPNNPSATTAQTTSTATTTTTTTTTTAAAAALVASTAASEAITTSRPASSGSVVAHPFLTHSPRGSAASTILPSSGPEPDATPHSSTTTVTPCTSFATTTTAVAADTAPAAAPPLYSIHSGGSSSSSGSIVYPSAANDYDTGTVPASSFSFSMPVSASALLHDSDESFVIHPTRGLPFAALLEPMTPKRMRFDHSLLQFEIVAEESVSRFHIGQVVFTIELRYGDFSWLIRRRRRQLVELHVRLTRDRLLSQQLAGGVLPDFPRRHFVSESDAPPSRPVSSFSSSTATATPSSPTSPTIPSLLLGRDRQTLRDVFSRFFERLLHDDVVLHHPAVMRFLEVSPFSFVRDLGPKGSEGAVSMRTGGERSRQQGCLNMISRLSRRWRDAWLILKEHCLIVVQEGTVNVLAVAQFDSSFELRAGYNATRTIGGIVLSNMFYGDLRLKCASRRFMRNVEFETSHLLRTSLLAAPQPHRSSFPVRVGSTAQYFVHGDAYLEAVYQTLLSAREEIYIADWWLSPELYLRRCPDPTGTSLTGLDDTFRLDMVLGRKAADGVRIFIVLYHNVEMAVALDSEYSVDRLNQLHENITCVRHPAHQAQGVWLWAHHEKLVVVDQSLAFVGGIDLCFGRYDTADHRLTDMFTSEPLNSGRNISTGIDVVAASHATLAATTAASASLDPANVVSSPQALSPSRVRHGPLGMLHLRVAGACHLSARDFISRSSDPYFVIEFEGEKHTSRICARTCHPVWNEIFNFSCTDLEARLVITVYDRDRLARDDLLGQVSISLKDMLEREREHRRELEEQEREQERLPEESKRPVGSGVGESASAESTQEEPVAVTAGDRLKEKVTHMVGNARDVLERVRRRGKRMRAVDSVLGCLPTGNVQTVVVLDVGAPEGAVSSRPYTGQLVLEFDFVEGDKLSRFSIATGMECVEDESAAGASADDSGSSGNPLHPIFPGKDYSNPLVRDFFNLRDPFSDSIARHRTPRLPWHDMSVGVTGAAARDVAYHFVRRWNHIKTVHPSVSRNPKCPFLIPRGPLDPSATLTPSFFSPGFSCSAQLLRSCGEWSSGHATDSSIQQAYCDLIEQSQHYVYIENQFFISSLQGDHVYNRIADALFSRIARAIELTQNFRVIVVMPLLPAFEGELGERSGASLQTVIHWNYRSICRAGGNSLCERIQTLIDTTEHCNKTVSDFITFHGLRTFGVLPNGPTTEQVYVHSKALICDDRCAIIGSANINDRSMLGSRDSEVCLYIRDTEIDVPTTLDGREFMAGRFCHSLRKHLFEEFLGRELNGESAMDVLSDAFYRDVWHSSSHHNTLLYRSLFACLPDDQLTNFNQLSSWKAVQMRRAMAVNNPRRALSLLRDPLTGPRGLLVDLPLLFLRDENLTPSVGQKEFIVPIRAFT